jgi:hypothetical protein
MPTNMFFWFLLRRRAVEVCMSADRVLISLHTIHHYPGTPLPGQLFNYRLQTETAGTVIMVAISIQSFLQLWRPIPSCNYDD